MTLLFPAQLRLAAFALLGLLATLTLAAEPQRNLGVAPGTPTSVSRSSSAIPPIPAPR